MSQRVLKEVDSDDFLEAPFSVPEVAKCIKGLNKGKSPGFDFVTAEHLQYAGVNFVRALTLIINRIFELEFIPIFEGEHKFQSIRGRTHAH